MFGDINLSEDASRPVKERIAQLRIYMYGIDMNVSVFTTMTWPVTNSVIVEFPKSVTKWTDRYHGLYYENLEGRLILAVYLGKKCQ